MKKSKMNLIEILETLQVNHETMKCSSEYLRKSTLNTYLQ